MSKLSNLSNKIVVLIFDNREQLIGKTAIVHLTKYIDNRMMHSSRQGRIHLILYYVYGSLHLLTLGFLWRNKAIFDASVVLKAPGISMLAVAEFVFSKKQNEKVFVPIIADMREEYFEALSQSRIWKARWVRIRGTYSFFAAMGLDRAFAFVSFFVKAWKSVN